MWSGYGDPDLTQVIEGGYDGVFGAVKIWGDGDKVGGQMRMF